jgi:hypothetical protein
VHNSCLHHILRDSKKKNFVRVLSPQKTDFLTILKSLKME